jgi:hypothetical protein
MKRQKKILFGIIFTLGILIFSGLNTYSRNTAQPNCIEVLAGNSCTENSISSDNDSFDDDQIYNTNELSSSIEPISHIYQFCCLVIKHSISVWQPPKIS